jgi:hypothetical protein
MCATARKDERAAAVELRSGKKKGVGVRALGRMHIHSARGISDNGAHVGDDGKSTRISFVGRAGYGYLFLYRLLTLTCGPDTIFSELKLASLKYYTP